MKWVIGAVLAAFAAVMALPGIVSAHEAELTAQVTCVNVDGEWTIVWTLTTTNTPNDRELDGFDDDGFQGSPPGDDESSIDNGVINPIDGDVAPGLTLGDFGLANNDGIVGNGSADAETTYDVDTPNQPNTPTVYAEGRVQWSPTSGGSNSNPTLEQDVQSNEVSQPHECGANVVCVDGETLSVTDREKEQGDLEAGACVPQTPPQAPPAAPPATTLPPAAPVEPVAEVLPAALPATGMGPAESTGFAWTTLLAAALIGLGGMTAVAARQSRP